MSPLFGTDGVRGVANSELTPELAFRIGRAAATVLHDGVDRERPIIVGRDTRVSGSMLEAAIVAGVTSAGSDALLSASYRRPRWHASRVAPERPQASSSAHRTIPWPITASSFSQATVSNCRTTSSGTSRRQWTHRTFRDRWEPQWV